MTTFIVMVDLNGFCFVQARKVMESLSDMFTVAVADPVYIQSQSNQGSLTFSIP